MSEYPRMLYHEDGRTQIVNDADEEQRHSDFGKEPSDIHRTTQTAIARPVEVSGQDEIVRKIRQMLEEFFPQEDKPRRGRPPGKKDSDNG